MKKPVFLLFFLSSFVYASGISYQGRIFKPDGAALESSSVEFRLQVRSPGSENCVLFEETRVVNMAGSGGVFNITLNDGNGTRVDAPTYTLDQAFANRGVFTLPGGQCASGTTYTPAVKDNRKLIVYFKDEGASQYEPLPILTLNYVPSAMYALESQKVDQFGASSLLRAVDGSGNPTTVSALTPAQITEFLAIVNGTSTSYVSRAPASAMSLPSYTSAAAPSSPVEGSLWYDSTDKVMKFYNGTSNVPVASSGSIAASAIASGTMDTARLGSGTANTTTFLRGDSTWTTVSGSKWTSSASDIYFNTGNVGVGTTSPGYKLQVLGAGTSVYSSSSATVTHPAAAAGGAAAIALGNSTQSTGTGSYLILSPTTLGGTSHTGYIGAISTSSTFSPAFVFGMRDGAISYSEKMRISELGNVGIGTIAPARALEVSRNADGVRFSTLTEPSQYYTEFLQYYTGMANDTLFGINSRQGGINLGNVFAVIWNSTASSFHTVVNGYEKLRLQTGATDRVTIDASGNVGIGVTSPTSKLQVAGDITPDTTATKNLGSSSLRWNNIYLSNAPDVSSDIRLKKDIKTSDLGLDFINLLRPVSWTWKDQSQGTTQHYGVIAQEAESAIAKAKGQDSNNVIVTHNEETDSYSVRYTELISPLIKAIQELYAKFVGQEEMIQSHAREISSKADQAALNAVEVKTQLLWAEYQEVKQENAKLKANEAVKDSKIKELEQRLEKIEESIVLKYHFSFQ